jgi:endonuclease/exonuclease/phosphatase family metal-dependent hydrolase
MTIRTLLLLSSRLLGVAAAVLALVLPMALPAQDGCNAGQCIRIGSYNIKLFAQSGPANTPTEIAQLADRIAGAAQSNLDVVVLQEINKNGENWKGVGGLRERLRQLGYEVAIEGSFGGDDPGRPQFVILLYRISTIALNGSAQDIDIPTTFDAGGPCEYRSLRPPVTAALKSRSGSFDFRIIGVHLKSQNPVGNSDLCDDQIRSFQAERILAHINKLKVEHGETNVVTVGDFNASFNASEYSMFRDAGYRTMIEGDCSALKLDQCSFIVPTHASIIDHVVVHSSLKQAVAGTGMVGKIEDHDKYLQTQSDHAPVWASFRTDLP